MLQYSYYNRHTEQKELLRSFEKKILRYRETIGYIIRGRIGLGKTRLVEEFIKKLQDVEILSEIPSFDSDKNIIRYSCSVNDDTPYKAFVKITEEIYNQSKLMDIFEKIMKLGLAVFGINDALNAVNDLVKSIQSNKNEKSIAKKEAKLFNSYRNFLKKKSKKSPIIIFIQNVQWLDSYSLKLIGKLLKDGNGMWCMILLEEDEEETIEEVHRNINQLVYERKLYKLNVSTLDRSFPDKLLSKTFGNGFFTGKELDILYTISEGCPGKLIHFIERKCIGEGWISKIGTSWRKDHDFIEKIKPPKQKLIELIISLFEDKIISDSESRLIKKMAGLWGLTNETVNSSIDMIKDILTLGYTIKYNMDWGIVSSSSVLVSDEKGHRYIVESIANLGDKPLTNKVNKRGINHKNLLEAHEIQIFENETLIIWDYFEEKKNREGLINEIERHIQNNAIKFLDLSIGLSELHHNEIYHGYIRPEAIIEYKPGKYQLATFDNSILKFLHESEKHKPWHMQYYPPEYLTDKEWNFASDIYSFGVLFYNTLTGSFPFYGKTETELLNSIKTDTISFTGHLSSLIPDDLKLIISKCLEFDQRKRYKNAALLVDDLLKIKDQIKVNNPKEIKDEDSGEKIEVKSASFRTDPKDNKKKRILYPAIFAVLILISFAAYWFFIKTNKERIVKKEIVINVEIKNHTEKENRILDADIIRYLLIDDIMQSSDAIILTKNQFGKIYHDNNEQMFVPSVEVRATVVNHDFNYELKITKTNNLTDEKNITKAYDFTDPSELLISKIELATKFILDKESLLASTFTDDWDAFTNFYKGEQSWIKIDVNNALRYFNKACAIDSGFILAKLRLSEIYRFKGSNINSMELLNDIMPQLNELSKADSLKALSIKNKISGNFREAINNIRMIVTYLKARKEPYYDLAEVYFELRDIDNAKMNYEYALELDPNFVQAINHYAYCFSHTGDHDKALRYFRKYLSIDSTANAYDSFGDGLLAAGKLDSAVWAKKEGLRLAPDLDYLYSGLTNIQIRQRNFELAEQNINKFIALQNGPESLSSGYTDKAYIYFCRGDLKMALDTCLKAQRIYDAFDLSTRNHKMHWLLAQIYLQEENSEKFHRELEEMDSLIIQYDINANNYNELLKYNLHVKALDGYLHQEGEKIVEIANYFDMELRDKVKDWGSPFGPAFFYSEYGRLLMDQPEEAKIFFNKALEYNPQYTPAKELLSKF